MLKSSPSRTAFRVALRRAAHQVVDQEPLVFPDPFALRIVGEDAAEELRRTPPSTRRPHSAGMRAWMVTRARYAEDVLGQRAASVADLQYLVLGAGLDTFALRNPHDHVRVFEVDHPATQGWKAQSLEAARLSLPPTTRLVPVDFETQSLHTELERSGFNFRCATVVTWLGVVPYLSLAAFQATCRVLGGLPEGTSLTFDYGQPREVLSPVEQLMHDSLAARVALAGEPFQLFFTPRQLAQALLPFGFHVKEDLGGAELNALYLQGRADGLHMQGSAGRICQAHLVPPVTVVQGTATIDG